MIKKQSIRLNNTCNQLYRYLYCPAEHLEELIDFSEQLKDCDTKFSAAGFFVIGSNTLFRHLNTIISYFIVVTQLRH